MKSWRAKIGGSEFKVCRLHEAAPDVGAAERADSPQVVVDYLRPRLANAIMFRPDVENFIVIHLTTRLRPIGFEVISTGTLDTLLVRAAEVFRLAIIATSASIIVAHNHPSGDPTPSSADISFTRSLIKAGELLGIKVTDHVILGHPLPGQDKDWFSLRDHGYFQC